MARVGREIDKMGQSADAAGMSMKEMFKQAALFSGAAVGVAGIKEFGSQILNVRKQIQGFSISLSTLLGNETKAVQMMGEFKRMAATTPLMLKDLAGGAQTMLGFNIAAEQVIPSLKAIGDISMGDAQKFQSLTLAFSQMSATGKLMGQDLLQMINAGFNPLAQMSKTTGKSISQLKDEMSQGAISAEMVAKAFQDATSEGGQFYGMLEKQGKGMAGQMAQLQGTIDDMFNELGESADGFISGSISALTAIVQNYDKVGKAIATVVAAYGTYKAALMAVMAVEMAGHVGWGMTAKSLLETAKATKAATAAMRIYNAVLKSNPYVLAATAVVALAGAIWTFASNADKAVDVQRELNREVETYADMQRKQKEEAERLLQVIQDETVTDSQRIAAYEQLKVVCAALTNEYKLEELQVLKLADAYRALNEIQEKQSVESKVETINKQVRAFNELQRMIATRGSRNQSRLSEETTAYLNSLGFVGMEPEKIAAELKKNIAKLKSEVQPILDRQNAAQATTYQQDAKKAMDDWKKAKATYDRLLKEQGSTSDAVKVARAAMEAADKAYEDLTGQKVSAASQGASKRMQQSRQNNEQLTELEERQARERKRAARDAELATEQAIIETMKEGAERKRRQLDQDFNKEVEQIKREREDLLQKREEEARALWEAQNPDGKESWVSSGEQAKYRAGRTLSPKDEQMFTERIKAATEAYNRGTADILEAEQQHMRDYLREYGTFQEQKLAIAQDYDKRIDDAEDEWQRRSLQREREKALKSADATAKMLGITGNADYVNAMVDPESLGTGAIKDLQKMLQEAKVELSELPADQLRAITDLMASLDDELVRRNPFGAVAAGLRSLADAREDVKQAKKEMAEANAEYQKAMEGGDKDVTQAKDAATRATQKYTDAVTREQAAEAKVKKGKDAALNAIGQLASSINGLAATTDQFGGKTSQMISAVGSLVNFVGAAVQTTSLSTATAIKTIESASVILAVISAAIQLATAAADLFGLTKDDSRYQDAKEEYNALVSTWDDLIARKKEYMSISWGAEVTNIGEESRRIIENQVNAARELARERLGAGGSIGSHSYGYRMNRDLRGYLNQIGVGEIEDLTRMTGEELQHIKEDYAVFWAKMDADFRSYLEDIIAGVESLESIEDQVKEKFTSMTFDGMYDSFVDTLMDMDASTEDFADNVSEYFMRAILNNKIGEKYRDQLEQWYNDMASMLEAGGGDLTQGEISQLQDRYRSIVDSAVEMRDKIAQATGYGVSQSALATSVSSSFSQESVDEVNGRLTALQLGQQRVAEQGLQLVGRADTCIAHLSDLVELAAIRNGVISDIFDRMAVMSRSIDTALAQIADNTKAL